MTMHRVSLLGATGSIGASTLDVIARHPERFEVVALAANRDADKLAALCRRYRPRLAALRDADAARALERDLAGAGCRRRCWPAKPGSAPSRRCRRRTRCSPRSSAPPGLRAHARRRACRQAHPARQQGGARDRRRRVHGCGRRRRRDAPAHRQRAQRDLPVPARAATRATRRPPACAASCSPRRAVRSARGRLRNSRA